MLLANNPDGKRITATSGGQATCPACGADLVAKCGAIKIHHWAHRSIADCDTWHEPETAWHVAWKQAAAEAGADIEVTIGNHRADARTKDGLVIEFQHSPMDPATIAERERHYGNMVWVLDASPFRENIITIGNGLGDPELFRWKRPKAAWLTATKPVFFDLGDELLLVEGFCETSSFYHTGRMVTYEQFDSRWIKGITPAPRVRQPEPQPVALSHRKPIVTHDADGVRLGSDDWWEKVYRWELKRQEETLPEWMKDHAKA